MSIPLYQPARDGLARAILERLVPATASREGFMSTADKALLDALVALGFTAADKTHLNTLWQPHYARFYRNAAHAALTTGVLARIAYDTLDTGTNVPFVNTAGLFTLNSGYDGEWEVYGSIRWPGVAGASLRSAFLRKNGTVTDIDERHSALNDSLTTMVFGRFALVAGDTVDIAGIQYSGGNLAPLAGTTYGTCIYLNWVGNP